MDGPASLAPPSPSPSGSSSSSLPPPGSPPSGPPSSGSLNQQLLRLAELLQLGARAREVSSQELPFVIANETIRAIAYDQAVVWDARTRRIVALSGVESVQSSTPYVISLNRLFKATLLAGKLDQAHAPESTLVAESDFRADAALAPQILWWPLRSRGRTVAVLLLARRDPWGEAEAPLLEALGGAYAESWELGRARPASMRHGTWRLARNVAALLLLGALLGVAMFPVRTSAIAPAEVVARTPAFVRAPFAGVVDSIEVPPNSPVRVGQVLVRLDRRELDAALHVAAKAMDVATAQYRQATQEGISDPRAREQLATLRGRLAEARADYEYRRTRLERADILSPADGIAVFNDPAEWVGRPVETGERIMQVSPPVSSRVEIELPVADASTFDEGAEVLFFNNVNPDRPSAGKVTFMSYASSTSPTGVLIYTVRADLDGNEELRLGLKGTAKIFGAPRPLLLQILRRPIAYLQELSA